MEITSFSLTASITFARIGVNWYLWGHLKVHRHKIALLLLVEAVPLIRKRLASIDDRAIYRLVVERFITLFQIV